MFLWVWVWVLRGFHEQFPAWHLQGDNFVGFQSHLRKRALKDSNQNSKEEQGFCGKMPGVYVVNIDRKEKTQRLRWQKVLKRFQAENEPWANLRVWVWGVGVGWSSIWAEQKMTVAPQEEESIRDGEAYS